MQSFCIKDLGLWIAHWVSTVIPGQESIRPLRYAIYPLESIWSMPRLWAVKILEHEVDAACKKESGSSAQPNGHEEEAQRKYYYECPEGHSFTTRASGSDAICSSCRRDLGKKFSVISSGYEGIWPDPLEIDAPIVWNMCQMLPVRIDVNYCDVNKCSKV